MLFHLLHNTFVDMQPPADVKISEANFTSVTNKRFQNARDATTVVFRHIVRYDLMQRILHPGVYGLYNDGPDDAFLDPEAGRPGSPLPLEFSHGAFRFAHAMLRQNYRINSAPEGASLSLATALEAASSPVQPGAVPLDKSGS